MTTAPIPTTLRPWLTPRRMTTSDPETTTALHSLDTVRSVSHQKTNSTQNNSSKIEFLLERDKSDKNIRNELLNLLTDYDKQCLRLVQCGTFRNFCNIPKLCPCCCRIRQKKYLTNIISIVPSIEEENRDRVKITKTSINSIQTPITRLLNALYDDKKINKSALKGDLRSIKENLKQIKTMRTKQIVKLINNLIVSLKEKDYDKNELILNLEEIQFQLKKENNYTWKFITLSLKPSPDLEHDIDKIGNSFNNLWRTYLNVPGVSAFKTIQVGQNRNVHIHLLYFGPFVCFSELKDMWLNYTGDSCVVNVKSIDMEPNKKIESLKKRINYQLKYPEIDIELLVEWFKATKGKHLIKSYGQLKKELRKREKEEGEKKEERKVIYN